MRSSAATSMSSALLSQALCAELSASRLHVIRRPLTSLLHFSPQPLQDVRHDRRAASCTARASSLVTAQTPTPADASQQQLWARTDDE